MANKFLKFEYWNTCDLGNIYYQGGQHFWFYLDGDVLEPFHEDTEEGQENGGGDFIPTLRRQMKRYRIKTGLVPDYLIDAMQRMKLHDHIELTFKTGEVEQIYNLDIEPEWQFEKYCWQGTVTMVFDMDEKVVLGACCDNLTVGTGGVIPDPEPIPDLYWVAQTGSDVSGDGSFANPWATFGYASTQAVVPGDVIHMKAGTITETVQSNFALGVSIIGAGATSIITSSSALNPIFAFASGAEGTNGNQSISYIRMDGNLTTLSAIVVRARSNVSIHHCEFEDFFTQGVIFVARVTGWGDPTTPATGNSFHDNIIINCADYVGSGPSGYAEGNLNIGGQTGMLIYNNTISQSDRGVSSNGFAIKYAELGYFRGLKIYNNIINVPIPDGVSWSAAIELWNCKGGIEIYDNTIEGDVDFSGEVSTGYIGLCDTAGYGFAAKVHNNVMGRSALETLQNECMTPEQNITGGLYIYRNLFQNTPVGIGMSGFDDSIIEDVYIYYNIFNGIGVTGEHVNQEGHGVLLGNMEGGSNTNMTFNNINILNNVFYAGNTNDPTAGVFFGVGTGGVANNIRIINNIFQGFLVDGEYGASIAIFDGTVNTISVENNDYYGNGNSNAPVYTCTFVGKTEQNNITTIPGFVTPGSNFHLAAGSGCINTGIVVFLFTTVYDFDGVVVSPLIEIGAYQYIP